MHDQPVQLQRPIGRRNIETAEVRDGGSHKYPIERLHLVAFENRQHDLIRPAETAPGEERPLTTPDDIALPWAAAE